ncbi:MAG: HAMP domain-containing protein, partial [Alphaproteobacteria bacterium]|nr:HAMP domain-containing protein [Alphaproteobacteria bacterium]
MSKFGITARIAAGFGAIIFLLVVVGVAAVVGIQTLSGVAHDYRFANDQTGEITDYVADYHQMVVSVRNYVLAPSEEVAQEARVWIDDVATNDPDGVAKFESLPIARAEISKIEVSAADLRSAFDELIALEAHRLEVTARVGAIDEQMVPQIDGLIKSAEGLGSVVVLGEVARVVNSSQHMGSQAEQFINTRSEASFQLVTSLESELLAQFDKLSAQPVMAEAVAPLRDAVQSMGSAIRDARELFAQFNAIVDERLVVRTAELEASYKVLTSEVRANQDALGPVSEQTAGTTMLVVSILSAVAILAGLGLAFVTGKWLSGAIGRMSHNMKRMAEGDLDLDLGPAPKATELGLMAKALETFRTNGLEMRSMDAEKEAVRARERQEQEMRTHLQQEVADVVSAAVAGDFSKRIDGRYDEDDLNALAHAVNELVETVDRGIGETGEVLAAVADTDLTQRVTGSYKGAFERLKANTNAVADKLAEVVGQIKQTSRGLKTATGEILSGANDLSERTTKQAATIEETSAAMEQLAHTVMENAKRAGAASEQAKK